MTLLQHAGGVYGYKLVDHVEDNNPNNEQILVLSEQTKQKILPGYQIGMK